MELYGRSVEDSHGGPNKRSAEVEDWGIVLTGKKIAKNNLSSPSMIGVDFEVQLKAIVIPRVSTWTDVVRLRGS